MGLNGLEKRLLRPGQVAFGRQDRAQARPGAGEAVEPFHRVTVGGLGLGQVAGLEKGPRQIGPRLHPLYVADHRAAIVLFRRVKLPAPLGDIAEIEQRHGKVGLVVEGLLEQGFGLVQIPIFIATFHLLGLMPQLYGQSFLWIGNLGLPDAILAFPVAVPVIGDTLNFFPFLLATSCVVIAAASQFHAQPAVGRVPEWWPAGAPLAPLYRPK